MDGILLLLYAFTLLVERSRVENCIILPDSRNMEQKTFRDRTTRLSIRKSRLSSTSTDVATMINAKHRAFVLDEKSVL